MALEHHKKLLDDRAEFAKKLGTALDDTFPKLMSRDQDVNREFARMEKRINRHRVALDKAEERILALEEAMALQHARMESMLDKMCHCQTGLVNLLLPHHLVIRLMGLFPRMLLLKGPSLRLPNCLMQLPLGHLLRCFQQCRQLSMLRVKTKKTRLLGRLLI